MIQSYTTNSVISADGTKIGYRQLGAGPGIILLHGAMQSAQNFMKLGGFLSDAFTVYIIDRRGRGLSGPHGDRYGIARECEDVAAVIQKTGAQFVFGLSSGAVVALQSALTIPAIQKVAVYEPPLSTKGSTPLNWIHRYRRELAQRKLADAFITAVRGTQASRMFAILPRFLSRFLISHVIKNKPVESGDVSIGELIPTMGFDHQMVSEMSDKLKTFKTLNTEVLLLGGSKSAAYLHETLDALSFVLPHSKKIVFRGLDHLGPDDHGAPEVVANELKKFFG